MPENPEEPQPVIRPVILAGGSGTRLWPLSRQHYAKQFLALDGELTMLQATVSRLQDIPHQSPLVVCNEDTRFIAAEQLRQFGQSDALILLEPEGRNTAPAVTLAAFEALSAGDDPILLVMPADHKIADTDKFSETVEKAVKLADSGYLVTFGVTPTSPETGFGYIKRGKILADAYSVVSFVEKPSPSKAEEFAKAGNYYWNAGIFMFRASKFLEELETYRPDILKACGDAFEGNNRDLDFLRFDEVAFRKCSAESIDYAVMENTESAVVIPLDVTWSDVGSWDALWEALPKDSGGNHEIGDVISLNGSGNYIRSSNRLVATIGLENTVVVETKDAVFVGNKDSVSDVKKLVERLEADGRSEAKYHRDVYRPWGKYDTVDAGERYQVKRLTVNPGARLSLQKHVHRAEHWVVVRGTAKVIKGSETITLTENQSTYIPLGEVHSLENPGIIPLELIEVQSGSYLGEDDIVRII